MRPSRMLRTASWRRPARLAAIPLAGLLASLAPAAPASAITQVIVQVHSDTDTGLRIQASSTTSGDRTSMRVTADGTGALSVTDESNGSSDLQAQGDCQEGVNPFTGMPFVRCSAPRLAFVDFTGLGTVDDRLTLEAGSGDCRCNGGSGNDVISGADGADLIQGAGGDDTLRGGSGDDVLEGGIEDDTITTGSGADDARGEGGDDVFANSGGGGSDGPDRLDGGAGFDTVSYELRLSILFASPDDVADDGVKFRTGTNEGDNISTTVERIIGGSGADRLVGSSRPETLEGGDGNDRLLGGSPPSGTTAQDDTLKGGLGSDVLKGEGGKDTLFTGDAIDDQVNEAMSCGLGASDRLNADVRDDDTRPLPGDCETIDQGMVGEHPNVRIGPARLAGHRSLRIRLQCPRRTRNGCAGRLAVRSARARGRGRFGRPVRYRVRRGRSRAVVVRTRRAAHARRGARIRVRSLESGRLGPRTTLRTLTVRAAS